MRRTAVVLALVVSILGPTRSVCAPAGEASKRPPAFHIYRSEDPGLSWSKVGLGLPTTERINALAVDGSTAFAGTDAGIFVSRDAGRTWSPSFTTATRVQSLVATDGRIYAGTRSAGVFVTVDVGRTWRQINDGLGDQNVRSLVAEGSLVYAGTDSKGVYVRRSSTWASLGEGLPQPSQVFDLATARGQVYAALYSNGLYRVPAIGGRWQRVGRVTPLEVIARGANLIAGHNPGGIYHSADGGETWKLASGLRGRAPIWAMGEAGPNVLAGTSPGAVFVSRNLGASWHSGNAGLPPETAVIAVAGAPTYTLIAVAQ